MRGSNKQKTSSPENIIIHVQFKYSQFNFHVMSRKIECQQCGSMDFRVESGFYFCTMCHMQSQEVRQQMLEEYTAGLALHKVACWKPPGPDEGVGQFSQSESAKDEVKKSLSSWEVYNYILKGLVDELIQLGAPKIIKHLALQLWATYLSKIEVAFTSTTINKKPKMGLFHREADAALFYKGAKSLRFHVKQRKKSRSLTENSSTSGKTSLSSAGSRKRLLGKGKRRLAQAEYNESQMALSFESASYLSSSGISVTSGEEERIHHSTRAKKDLESLNGNVEPLLNPASYNRKFRYNQECLTITTVVGIIRIALLLSGSDIQLGDLLRWADEGYLSLQHLHKFVPDHLEFPPEILKGERTKTSYTIQSSARLATYLNVSAESISSSRIICKLVKRYCKTLNLPACVVDGLKKMLRINPPRTSFFCNHEAQAMALILFALKLLIGLDDITEYNYVPQKNEHGIIWEEWCRQYMLHLSKKATDHYPTLCRLYPNSYIGRESALLSHWDLEASRKKRSRGRHHNLLSSMKAVLKRFSTQIPEPKWKPGLEMDDEKSRSQFQLAVLGARQRTQTCAPGKRVEIVKPAEELRPNPRMIKWKGDKMVRLLHNEDNGEYSVPKLGLLESLIYHKKVSHSEKLYSASDSIIWIYHSGNISYRNNRLFKITAAEVLPSSFYWLLCELASTIRQAPSRIYMELTIIEKAFLGIKSPRSRW